MKKSVNAVALENAINEVKRLRTVVKAERIELKAQREKMKVERIAAREVKAQIREAKKAERIAKLEAKLQAMKNPVGTKAIKANKKPGAVTIIKGAK